MAQKRWSDWLDDVMPSLPGAKTDLVEAHIRKSAIKLCHRSHFFQTTLDDISVVSGTAIYDISYDRNTTVVRIESATLDGYDLIPAGADDLVGDYQTAAGVSSLYALVEPDQIQLIQVPDTSGTLIVKVSLKPTQDSASIDGTIFEQFRDAIASGAMSTLMAIPLKPWTNLPLAGYHREIFDAGVTSAEARVAKAVTRGPLRTTTYGGA